MTYEKNIDSEILFLIAKIVRNFDPEEIDKYYNEIFELLKELISYTYSSIFLYNEVEEKIELVTKKGEFVDLIELVSFELGKGFSAWVAKNKKTVLLNNLSDKKFSTGSKKKIKSFMSIPLLIEKKLVGVINFAHTDKNAFKEDIVPTLELIATLLATIIDRFQLIKKMTEKNHKISDMNKKLKEAQDKVLKMERIEAVTATVISLKHEVNNPLMVIKGHLSLLKNEFSEKELSSDRIEKIDKEVDRISEILIKMENIEDPVYKKYVSEIEEDLLLDF